MARGTPYRFARFGRGLNTTDGPYSLKEGYEDDPAQRGSESRGCLNVVSRSRGNIGRRNGCQSLSNLAIGGATTPQALSTFTAGSGSDSFLFVAYDNGTLVAISTTYAVTTLGTGLSTFLPWYWVRGTGDIYYGTNGSTRLRVNLSALPTITTSSWNPTSSVVTSPGSVYARFSLTTSNRTFSAGDASRPYSFFISEINDPTALVAEVQLNPAAGYPITGLGTSGPYVLAFTEREIHVIYDTETGANRRLATGFGTLAPRSIVETENGTFFLDSRAGVMVCDGNTAPRPIGTQIQPTWDSIGPSLQSSFTGVWHRRHYYLSGQYGSSWGMLDYDADLDSWWPNSVSARAVGVWSPQGAGTARMVGLYGSGAGQSQLWQLFVEGRGSDPDGDFTSYWSSPFHTFGAPHLRKRGREIHFDGKGLVSVTLTGGYDPTVGTPDKTTTLTSAGTGRPSGGSGVVTSGIQIGEDSVYSFGVARAWSVTFTGVSDFYWEIDAYTMLMTARTE